MNKREFQNILDKGRSSLMLAAKDLGVAQSTVSRWTSSVPQYAQWYAIARAIMTDEQRAQMDAHFREGSRNKHITPM